MTELRVGFFVRGQFLIVRIEGELDFSNTGDVDTQIREAMSNDKIGLVIDLTHTRYMDSAGVRMIFGLVEQVEACRQGIGIVLAELSPIHRLVEVTNLETVAILCSSVEACLDKLGRKAEDLI